MRGAPCVPGGSEDKIFARGVNFAPLAAEWAARGARADMPQRTRTVSTAYSLFILGSVRAKRVRYKNETFAGDTGALPALRGGRNYARSSAARDRELRQATDRAGRGQICRREPKRSLRHILYLYWGVSALSMSVIKTRRLRGIQVRCPHCAGVEIMCAAPPRGGCVSRAARGGALLRFRCAERDYARRVAPNSLASASSARRSLPSTSSSVNV